MDILVIDGKAHELFPDGAPEMHKDLQVIRGYTGSVGAGWEYLGDKFIEPPVNEDQVIDGPEGDYSISPNISMKQFRLALLNLNYLDSAESSIPSLSKASQIEWGFSTDVRRDFGLVFELTSALGITDADMDVVFKEAGTL